MFVVAARAVDVVFCAIALRAAAPLLRTDAGCTAVRAVDVVVALRAVRGVTAARETVDSVPAVRADTSRVTEFVAVRAVVARFDVVGVVAVRETVVAPAVAARFTDVSSRTAASATPMQNNAHQRTVRIFFIPIVK